MKRLKFLSLFLVAALALAACGNEATEELDKNDTEKAAAKTDGAKSDSESKDKKKEEDIWTYYEDANWEGTFEDLHFNIQKVVVSDKAPEINDEGEEVTGSAVGFKMQMENKSTDKIYTSYPDQATLVTSTGEQVEADMFTSDSLGGEIHEGVIKEGNVIFYLERGEAEKIEWVKFTWSNSYEDPNGNYDNDIYEDTEVKLELK
ncbi:MAG: hypothetical protein ACI4XL_05665 [Bacillus sp. (in: firmicutes)]